MIQKAPDFGGLFSAQRIVITGANGAGKTRAAQDLGAQLTLPVTHMDAVKLIRDWHTRPASAIQADLLAASAAPKWIIEGGPGCLHPQVLARADAIVWLRPAHALRLWRMLRRSAAGVRPELPPGNADHLDLRALRFAWRSWRRSRDFDAQIAARLQGHSPLILRSFTQARQGAKLL